MKKLLLATMIIIAPAQCMNNTPEDPAPTRKGINPTTKTLLYVGVDNGLCQFIDPKNQSLVILATLKPGHQENNNVDSKESTQALLDAFEWAKKEFPAKSFDLNK